MLSRSAYAIYWMSRYIERADNVARFIYVNTHLILDMGRELKTTQWMPLIRASGDLDDFNLRYNDTNEKSIIHFLTFDNNNPNSIITCIQKARENARTIREIISSELWEAINHLYHLVSKYSRKKNIVDLQEFFIQIKNSNHLFTGLNENTMPHNESKYFSHIGIMLERADKTARLLDVKYFMLLPNLEYINSPYDAIEWGSVLNSVDGFDMYRKKFHNTNYHNITSFLILDLYFPRSICFCINSVATALSKIITLVQVDSPAIKKVLELKHYLDNSNIDTIINKGLHEFVDNLQLDLNIIDQHLYQSFFPSPS